MKTILIRWSNRRIIIHKLLGLFYCINLSNCFIIVEVFTIECKSITIFIIEIILVLIDIFICLCTNGKIIRFLLSSDICIIFLEGCSSIIQFIVFIIIVISQCIRTKILQYRTFLLLILFFPYIFFICFR